MVQIGITLIGILTCLLRRKLTGSIVAFLSQIPVIEWVRPDRFSSNSDYLFHTLVFVNWFKAGIIRRKNCQIRVAWGLMKCWFYCLPFIFCIEQNRGKLCFCFGYQTKGTGNRDEIKSHH